MSEPPGKPISKYVTESLTHVTGVNGALGLKWVTGQLVLKALAAQVRQVSRLNCVPPILTPRTSECDLIRQCGLPWWLRW